MVVALQSLRVTADIDVTAYARSAQQKVDADNRMIASDKARFASLAQADAAMAKIPGGMAAVNKALLDGYGAGQQFEAIIRRIGNSVDRGMGLDRAAVLLDAAYRKFGLTADAAVLAEKGFVSIAGAVRALNNEYSIHNEVAARAAAAAARVATAQQSQASYNSRYGIGGDAKSAKESADAFFADFGGIEGIAKAKAQQIGASFSAALDARMIAGAQKSARDSATVFDQELKRLEVIAQHRADQAGANFQAGLNASFGIGGPSAADRGATYSALAEQIERLDRVEQARAAHRAQQAQAGYTEVFAPGLDRTAKSARESADLFIQVAAAEEKAAAKAAALREAINPLEAEMVRLGKELVEYRQLLARGVITSDEFEQAQLRAAKRLSDVDMSMRRAATGGRVLSGELANLGYQVNDILTGIMLGQSPFMIMAQQGGQVIQIVQNSKASVGDFVSASVGWMRNFLTVGRLAFGGVAAAVIAGTLALNDYLSAQQKVAMGLLGSGRASGATMGSINSIAQSAAAPTGLSVAEARALATALAATGRVANDNILPIVKMGKDIAHIFGIDATEATKLLADAFSDPARGAEQLNTRLGFLDAAMQRQISNLVAQNRVWEAQRILTVAASQSLDEVSAAVSKSEKFWTRLGNAISNAWDATGEYLARGLNIQRSGAAERIQEAAAALERLQAMRARMVSSGKDTSGIDQAIDREIQKREEATAALKRYSTVVLEAQQRQFSFAQAAAVRTEQPQIDAIERLTNAQELLVKTMVDVQTSGGPASEILKRMGLSYEQLAAALATVTGNLKTFKSEFESQSANLRIANQAITAFSPSQKGEIARQQSLEATIGARMTPTEKATLAEQAYANAVKQSLTALSEAARQRELAGNQAVKSVELEINLIGKTLGQQAELRANLQARQQLEQEASQNRTAFDDAQYKRLQKINAELGKQTDLVARAAMNDNIKFGAQTSLLSPEDVQIAQQLRGIYPDVATALSSVEAAGLRTNQALSGLSSVISGQLTTGITDIATGTKSVTQGVGDMGAAVARAITEMIVKLYIVIPLMQALQATVNSLGFGLGDFGGASSTGASGVGGIGGLYANGQAFGSNVIPFAKGSIFSNKIFDAPTLFRFANGGRIANGMMGEAGPEAVMPLRRAPDGRLGVSLASGAGGAPANMNVNVNVKNYGNDNVEVRKSRNSAGDVDIELIVGNVTARQMGNPGSALRQATDQRGFLVRRG
jgi:phage-related minor tail protein